MVARRSAPDGQALELPDGARPGDNLLLPMPLRHLWTGGGLTRGR
jgi:hypothetical protein